MILSLVVVIGFCFAGFAFSDQKSVSTEKKQVTQFSGDSKFTAGGSKGTTTSLPNGQKVIRGRSSKYFDKATDSRVTGVSIWYVDSINNEDGSMKYWGTAELIVDNNGGKWEMTWSGEKSSDGGAIAYVLGTGKEGAVKGLDAKWTYIRKPGESGFYRTEGFIIGP